jgi:Mn-dependent DtxR family transcriptional regulator
MRMPVYLPKWIEVMALLYSMTDGERYCQRVYRRMSISSGHIRTMIEHLERLCLVERSPPRKIRYIRLTARGKELAELAVRMKSALGEKYG